MALDKADFPALEALGKNQPSVSNHAERRNSPSGADHPGESRLKYGV
jgi:hypothetical protein